VRIVVTADTHYHPSWRKALENAVAEIAGLQPDCLIVAGDVGERLDGYRHMLQLLQVVNCPRLILPGNHDLWARDGVSSEQLWSETLPQLTRDGGATWLEGENWAKNGFGVCGTIGWYDYTGKHPSIPMTDEQYFLDKRRLGMVDGDAIDWLWNDIEFAVLVGEAFSARLAALDADPAIREILVVTHVPAFAEAIARHPSDISWNFRNAYFYNLTLGRRIAASHKVRHVVSAHTHIGKRAQVGTPEHPIDMQVLDADYGKPAYTVLNV
jgi:predicted phosphohydrolase